MRKKLVNSLVMAVCVSAMGCSAAHNPGVGQSAPDFTLNSLAGQSVSLSQYRGKVVLLGFWAVG